MGKARKHTPEQIVNILRQIEVAVANGKTHSLASREAGITEQIYYRWRKEYGGLKVDQTKRLKELEQENEPQPLSARGFPAPMHPQYKANASNGFRARWLVP